MTTPERTCSIEGCNAPPKTRRLCHAHYMRWWRTGDPGSAVVRVVAVPDEHRDGWAHPIPGALVAQLDRSEGCWKWTGYPNPRNGYAYVAASHSGGPSQGRLTLHRTMWWLRYGAMPADTLDHLCSVRICGNPDHLEDVTMRENVRRGNSPTAIASRTGRCRRGHAITGSFKRRDGKVQRFCVECRAMRRAQP